MMLEHAGVTFGGNITEMDLTINGTYVDDIYRDAISLDYFNITDPTAITTPFTFE